MANISNMTITRPEWALLSRAQDDLQHGRPVAADDRVGLEQLAGRLRVPTEVVLRLVRNEHSYHDYRRLEHLRDPIPCPNPELERILNRILATDLESRGITDDVVASVSRAAGKLSFGEQQAIEEIVWRLDFVDARPNEGVAKLRNVVKQGELARLHFERDQRRKHDRKAVVPWVVAVALIATMVAPPVTGVFAGLGAAAALVKLGIGVGGFFGTGFALSPRSSDNYWDRVANYGRNE